MDKELFRKTEGILYDYNDLTNKIELLKAEIKEMEERWGLKIEKEKVNHR